MRGNHNVWGTDDEQSENPFGEDDDSSSDEQSGRRPRQNQREDNRRWESRMGVNVFIHFDRDTLSPVGLMIVLVAVEERMYQWLQNLKQGSKSVEDYSSEFYQLIAMNDIQETKDQLVSRYIGGLRVQIMDYVNMFDLMTLIDAYERSLAFEKQNHQVGSSSSPTIIGASGLGNVASRFAPSQVKACGGNTRPVSRASGSSGLKCFNCGEPGHRQSECKKADKRHLFANPEGDDYAAYKEYEEALIYKEEPECEEDCDNLIAAEAVQKLGLKTKFDSCRSRHTYKRIECWCDVVPMDACHLLLGRPWEYDRDINHNGRTNTYSFLFGGVKITLMPNKPKEVVSKPTDVFPDELPDGLPPLHDIQHHIDLEPDIELPKRQDCMKGKSFVWTEEAELAFQVVKEKLTTAPILILPDFSKVFELHNDASKVAIGGFLVKVEFVLFTDHDSLRHIRTQDKVDVPGLDVIRDMARLDRLCQEGVRVVPRSQKHTTNAGEYMEDGEYFNSILVGHITSTDGKLNLVNNPLDAAIDDPSPAAGIFNHELMCAVFDYVIKVEGYPEGSTLQRVPFYCTPPATADVVIPDPTSEDLVAGTPSSKILAKVLGSIVR
ncbi:putative reverse transcriptase domain-containing protein [Tanacetum coccineum]